MDGVKAMKDLGYTFNEEGRICKLDKDGNATDQLFHFSISDKHQECQSHYEELGTAITYYIYHLLENELKLKKLPVPKEAKDGTFIFVSENYAQKDVLLILIHGSGVVRAGQWSRAVLWGCSWALQTEQEIHNQQQLINALKIAQEEIPAENMHLIESMQSRLRECIAKRGGLIINENLEMGSQIPYIKKAISKDYGVMVLNTNDLCTSEGNAIEHNSTAEEHAIYVWQNYVAQTKASSIAIVAHSYGGVVTVSLANDVKKDFEKRVKAVALTDSVHGYSNKKIAKFLKEISRNWVSSQSPLDSPMKTPDFEITRVSAGHQKHEMTSYSCIESVFKFIDKKLPKK